jgi:ATP-binding protein involved in chromosome partitioning
MSLNDEELLRIINTVREPFASRSLPELGATVSLVQAADGGKSVDLTFPQPIRASEDHWSRSINETLLTLGHKMNLAVRSSLNIEGRALGEGDPVPSVKHVVLVMSGKGGVGKSTVAANLALGLKQMGAQVGLLDADIYGPSIPTLFDVSGPPVGNGQQILPIEKYGIGLMSIGFLLEDSKSAVIWRGPMLAGALKQFLQDVAWGSLDYLILDLPPGTGDIALSLSQMLRATGALIVTTPQEIALQDVYKAVTMNEKVGIPNLGVIENYSYFICGNCQARHELFGAGGGAKVASLASAPLLGQLPMHSSIREWSDAGMPVVQAAPESAAAQAFLEVAERLGARIGELCAHREDLLQIDRSGGQNRHLPIARG